MNDELEKLIGSVIVQCHVSTPWDKEATAIVAAIRERWCIQPHKFSGAAWRKINQNPRETCCDNCGQPKPDPAPADERGKDAEAIRTWREKD